MKSISDNKFKFDSFTDYYYREICELPLLTPQEERMYAKRVKEGDKEAKSILIERNLRLVIYTINTYFSNASMDVYDMIQEGNIGLIKAIEKYDYTFNTKFSTYAIYLIKKYILKAIAKKSRNISISTSLFNRLCKYQKIYDNLKSELMREPTIFEISNALNMSKERVIKMQNYLYDTLSYNDKVFYQSVDTDYDIEFMEFLPDVKNLEDIYIQQEMKMAVINLLNEGLLTDKEKTIILLRNGFINNRVYKLREIAEYYHVTNECIRKIELKAIKKLLLSKNIVGLLSYATNSDVAKERIKRVQNKKNISKISS